MFSHRPGTVCSWWTRTLPAAPWSGPIWPPWIRTGGAQAAFPFRIVALPSRELHRRVPDIAQEDDVVIIDTPQIEDHAGIARSALRYADEILIPCAPSPIEINRTTPVRDEIPRCGGSGTSPSARPCC